MYKQFANTFSILGNFAPISSEFADTLGIEYDFASTMHYRASVSLLFHILLMVLHFSPDFKPIMESAKIKIKKNAKVLELVIFLCLNESFRIFGQSY